MSSCRAVVSVTKTCQRCASTFSCGMSCCWCGEVPPEPAVVQQLQARFTDCLCPVCLRAVTDEYGAAQSTPGTVSG